MRISDWSSDVCSSDLIRIVGKAAVFDHQLPGVGAVAAGVPAQRCAAGEVAMDLHRAHDVFAFDLGRDVLVMDPAPAVRGDFMTGVEGKTFTPLALTVIMALVSAFVLSLTFEIGKASW